MIENEHTPNDRLWIALDRDQGVDASTLSQVRSALCDGADPNLMLRDFGNFRSAMTLACISGSMEAVDLLVAEGASVHWPGEEIDIDPIELCGEEGVGYAGFPVDPLTAASGRLAWLLGEFNPKDGPEIRKFDVLCRHLLGLGANPTRADPAISRTPFEHLLIEFTDAGGSTQDKLVLQTLGDLMFDVVYQQDAGSIEQILQRKWGALPLWRWEWDEDFPELADYLVNRAQHVALRVDTPKATNMRPSRL